MKEVSPHLAEFHSIPELCDLLASRRAVGRSGKVFTGLGALSTVNNLITLRRLMLHLKPKRTLEVGLCFGGSCLVFTGCHRDLHAPPVRQHVALDPFQQTVWDDAGLMAVENAGLAGYLDFRPGFSSLELAALVREGRQFDLIYIDGSHLFEDVFVDFYFTVRLLSLGGVAALDDCADPNIAKVLRFVGKNMSNSIEKLNLAPYRPDGGRSLKYRLAHALGRTQLRAYRRIGEVQRSWDAPFTDF
ncbi:MAG: class I SAM-dependent methyltransferase [Limisphaerales bacterium]